MSTLDQHTSLRESAERHHIILQTAMDGFCLLDTEGRLLEVNDAYCRMSGYSAQELLTMGISDLEDIESAADTARRIETIVAQGAARFESRQRRKDGSVFDIEVNVHYLPMDGGRLVAFLRDVTGRRQDEVEIRRLNEELEERVLARTLQLEATNRELEAFVYSVSHDLRQPLSAINAFSQLVVEDAGEQLSGESREHLARVRAAAQRMALMIDGLLELSRAARIDLVIEHVDVSAMAGEVVAELCAAQPERRVDLVVAPGLQAQADPAVLRVVLANLLGNALKFTSGHETARIEVGETVVEGERAFYVRDDGAGFDPAYAGKLFEPFHRLHRADEFPGTGIGLATVSRSVARLGGRVWAEAEVGKGATFFFTLPGAADVPTKPSRERAPTQA